MISSLNNAGVKSIGLISGKGSIWKMDCYFTHIREFMRESRGLRDLEEPFLNLKGHTLFTVALDQHYNKAFYKLALLDRPLRMATTLTGLGRSSLQYEDTVTDVKTGETLVKMKNVWVFVNQKTRRPAAWPEAFLKNAGPEVVANKPSKFPSIEESLETFSYEIVTSHTDVDYNFHLARSVYLKYCIDCGAKAAKSGFYKGIHEEFDFYQINHLLVLYKGESLPGQKIAINTWQDKTDKLKIYFRIRRGNDILIDSIITLDALSNL